MRDIAVFYYDKEGKIEDIVGQQGELLPVSFMNDLMMYCKKYIKKYRDDDRVEFENYKIQKVLEQEEAERRVKQKELELVRKSQPQQPCTTNIYLIYDSIRGVYKIGQSVDVVSRLKQLRTANAGIEAICSYRAEGSVERDLHQYFREVHISGEWFNLEDAGVKAFHDYFSKINAPLTNYKTA